MLVEGLAQGPLEWVFYKICITYISIATSGFIFHRNGFLQFSIQEETAVTCSKVDMEDKLQNLKFLAKQ